MFIYVWLHLHFVCIPIVVNPFAYYATCIAGVAAQYIIENNLLFYSSGFT